jgi:cytochrome oxidase assembly protein ShyY1
VVTGVPDWDHVLLVTGRVEGGRVGNRAIVPVATARGGHVLVDVGWIPSEGADAVITRERAVPGERTWSGLSRVYAEDPAATGGYAPEGGYQRRWRAVSPAAMGAAVDAAVPGFVVIAGEGIAEGAENPDTEPPIAGWPAAPEQRPHGQYAITWFGCAAALAAVWFRSSVRD